MTVQIKVLLISSVLVLTGCGGGDSSSSSSDRNADACLDTNLVETGGSTTTLTDPTTEETTTLNNPGSLTINISNSCDYDINTIDSDGNRYSVPQNSTINTGNSGLVVKACRSPYKPENEELENRNCIS